MIKLNIQPNVLQLIEEKHLKIINLFDLDVDQRAVQFERLIMMTQ